jgi:hypothetical protein
MNHLEHRVSGLTCKPSSKLFVIEAIKEKTEFEESSNASPLLE